MNKIKEKMLISALKVLPKNHISMLFGKFASIKFPKPINHILIKKFADFYNINLRELEKPITSYETLNDFFTRKLRKNARTFNNDDKTVISPADGMISQFGKIQDGKLLQVKGKYFNLESFLKDKEKAQLFKNGKFLTIYLSPQDYHRIHTPFFGKLKQYNYIKGKLFPVNKLSTDNISELFSTNERVIFYFHNELLGNFALIMVGATNVGSISLSFDDFKTNKLLQNSQKVEVTDLEFNKLDELAVFNLGSTVVLLFEDEKIDFLDLKINSKIKLGNTFAVINES